MLTRSDSGVIAGSQALQHVEETLKLQLLRAEMRGEDSMSFFEQMNIMTENNMDGRNSVNSVAGSGASSVKNGPISQTLHADTNHATSDWSCRRCVSLEF